MIKIGIYRHYKGKKYRVLFVGQHTETGESLIVYQALYGNQAIWIRPLSMFQEKVEVAGKKIFRFEFLEKQAKIVVAITHKL